MTYDALVVFGYGPVQPGPGGRGKLNICGRINALAAGMLYRRHDIARIIPTGAATGGEHLPSEAALMAGIIQRRFGVPADAFILEEGAFSTLMNVALVSNIIDRRGGGRLMAAAMSWHIPRIKEICNIFCLAVESFVAAEGVVRERSRRHAALLDRAFTVDTNPDHARRLSKEANRIPALREMPGYVLPPVGLVENVERVRRILHRAGPPIRAYLAAHDIDPDAADGDALRARLRTVPYKKPAF